MRQSPSKPKNSQTSSTSNIQLLFPTSIYYAEVAPNWKKLNSELLVESYKFSEIDDAGNVWSDRNYAGGYTSYGSMSNLHQVSTTFQDLEKCIDQHVRIFIQDLEMDIKASELKMTSCWVNIMPANVLHSYHLHPLSVVSGTYYVQTPKNCASLKFEDPRIAAFMASPPRKSKAQIKNQRYHSLAPKAGQVVLFESWLKHEVPMNRTEDPRVSISFNYDWV